jgi:hypothetical protein
MAKHLLPVHYNSYLLSPDVFAQIQDLNGQSQLPMVTLASVIDYWNVAPDTCSIISSCSMPQLLLRSQPRDDDKLDKWTGLAYRRQVQMFHQQYLSLPEAIQQDGYYLLLCVVF